MWHFMLIPSLAFMLMNFNSNVNCDITAGSTSGHDDLLEMLHTEKVLIDSLRHFIETQEQSLKAMKRKTQVIQEVHDRIGDSRENRDKYIFNPVNSVITLKRFTTDWKLLANEADTYLDTEDFMANITQRKKELIFPTEDDYDLALGNLLLIQDMFKLEPQRLSIGEVNGVKLGSEMSWSDCLEIGLRSLKKGYQTYAKFWMETALEKLPSVTNDLKFNTTDEQDNTKAKDEKSKGNTGIRDEYSVKARLEVLRSLLNVEYKAGNLDKALKIANEMLEFNPKQKNVIKAINQINKDKKKKQFSHKKTEEKKEKKMVTIKKSDEELMIEEMCRETTNNQQHFHTHLSVSSSSSSALQPQCILATHNLKWLVLQPLQVELLSVDPFIVIYHNVLSDTQSKGLKEYLMEKDDAEDSDEFSLQLTKIGMKKMQQINEKLHYVTGHELSTNQWQINRYNFENLMKVDTTAVRNVKDAKRQAGVLFNLQQPLLGGAILFPQLELSVNLPQRSVLHWSTLNEFSMEDYRTKYHICPVIGGTQITATTYVKLL